MKACFNFFSKYVAFLIFFTVFNVNTLMFCRNTVIQLSTPKNDWAAFFEKMIEIFKVDIFVETGTYMGDTSAIAAKLFKEVHTIELGVDLYKRAAERFKNNNNVFLYNGDSGKVFPYLLPKLKHGKVLFWIDAHFQADAARGDEITPVMKELEHIKAFDLTNSIILIDDLRFFGTRIDSKALSPIGYPYLEDVCEYLLTINPHYTFVTIGDILLVYDTREHVEASAVLQACTISRLYNGKNYNQYSVLKFEEIIQHAQDSEKKALEELNNWFKSSLLDMGPHYYLWYGLLLNNEGKYNQAAHNFENILKLGYTHWRIYWYLAKNYFDAHNQELAKKYVQETIKANPDFKEAVALLEKLT